MTEQHTADALVQELSSVAHEWGTEGKIAACVTDNEGKTVKAGNKVLRWNHVRCCAHLLNLIVSNAIQLPAMQNIIQKMKNITKNACRSTVASAKLQPEQNVLTR